MKNYILYLLLLIAPTTLVAQFTGGIGRGEATLKYLPPCFNPTNGGTISADQTICSGSTPNSLTTVTDPIGYTGTIDYKWQKSIINSTSGFTDILGATSANYSPNSLTQTTWYKRIARVTCMSNWTGAAESNVIIIAVGQASVGGTVSSAQSICSGTIPTNLFLTGNVGAVVKWQKSSNASFSSPTDINITSTTLLGSVIGSLTSNTYFRAIVQNGTCSTANSSTVLVSIAPETTGGTVSSNQTICTGTSPANLVLTGNVGAVVKWQKSTDVAFTSPSDILGTSTTLLGSTIGNLSANTYFRAVVQSGTCAIAYSSPVSVTINPVSVGGTVSSAQTICSGTAPANLILSGNVGSVVKWQKSTTAGFSSPTDIAVTSTTLLGSTIGNLSANTYFRAVVQNGTCTLANSTAILVTVTATSIGGTVSAAQTICTGTSPANLLLTGNNGSVVKWQKSTDIAFTSPTDITETSSSLIGSTIGPLTNDTYFRAVVLNGACSAANSSAVLITVITSAVGGSVSSDQTICAGTSPANLVLTGNIGSVVKWQKSADFAFTSPTDIAGTSTTLLGSTIGNLSSNTYFRAVVQSGTCTSANSTPVLVTINPVSVSGTVSTAQTICIGTAPENLTLSGNVGSVVKWQKSTNVGFTSPTDIAGTSTTLLGSTIGNLTMNTYFRAVVQNGICTVANSTPVLITVSPSTIGGTVSSDQIICTGTSPVDLNVSGNNGSVVKWQKSTDIAFTSPTDIPETTTTLLGSAIGNLTVNTYFRAIVQSGTCASANSTPILITINPVSVGGTISAAQTICSGTTPANLSLSGNIGSVVKWQKSIDVAFTSPTDIAGTSTILLGSTIGNLTMSTYFRAVVQSGTCASTNTTPILITINPVSVGGTISAAQTICSGTAPANLTLSGNIGSVVKWQKSSNVGFTSPTDIAGTSTTLLGTTIGNLTVNTYFRAVVQSGTCASTNTTPILITINPVSVGGTTSTAQTICAGTAPANLTLSGNVGTIVKWQKSANAAFTSPTDIAGTSTTLLGTTIGNLTVNTYFRAVVRSGTCASANSIPVLITIIPLSAGGTVSNAQTICSGTVPANLTLSGNVGNVVKWQKSTNAAFTSPTDIGETSTTLLGTTIGNLTTSTYFRAVVQSGTCSSTNSSSVLISVDSTTVGGILSGGTTICSGDASSFLSLTGNVGSVVKWQSSSIPFNTWSDISNTVSTYSPGFLLQTTQFRVVVQNGVCSTENSGTTTIVVNPPSVGGSLNAGTTQILLGQSTGNISLTGQNGSIIKWQKRLASGLWSDIPNTTNTLNDIPNIVGFWEYRAVVQNENCTIAYSSSVTIEVLTSNAGAVTGGLTPICLGLGTGTMTLGSYTGVIVKWQKRLNSGTWVDFTNTTSTYSENPSASGTWEYRAVINNITDMFSAPTTIIVNPTTVGGVISGESTVCIGNPSTPLSLNGYTGTILKWQSSIAPFTTWNDISNINATYTIGTLGQTTQFRAVVQSGTCASANSDIITATINPNTVGGSVTGGSTICSGSASGLLSLNGHIGNVIKWQSSIAPFSSWTDISNTGNTYTSAGLTQTTQFRAVVQNGICNVENSSPTTIVVDSATVGGVISTSVTQIYIGQSTATISLIGHTGAILKWQKRLGSGNWIDIPNTATTYSETPSAVGIWEYRVTIQSGSCGIEYSNSIAIEVLASNAGIVTGGSTPVCIGNSTGTLTLVNYSGTITKWQKRMNGGSWVDIANNTMVYSETPLTDGTWDYRAVINNGTDQFSTPATIVVNPATIGGSVTGETTICAGNTSEQLSVIDFTGSVVKWQKSITPFTSWSDITNSASTYTSDALIQTTQFRAVIKSGNCNSEYSAPATIQVDQMPTANFTFSSNNLNVEFTNQSINATSYSWLFGSGSATSTDVNPTFSYPVASTYTVILNAFNGQCSSTTSQFVTVTTIGIDEQLKQNINVFPIPTKGLLTVDLGLQIGDNAQLDIYDLTGKVVFSKQITNLESQNILKLDLSQLANGMYRLRIKDNLQTINKAFVIER